MRGADIRILRKRFKPVADQARVAIAAGIHPNTLADIENERFQAPEELLCRLADVVATVAAEAGSAMARSGALS